MRNEEIVERRIFKRARDVIGGRATITTDIDDADSDDADIDYGDDKTRVEIASRSAGGWGGTDVDDPSLLSC